MLVSARTGGFAALHLRRFDLRRSAATCRTIRTARLVHRCTETGIQPGLSSLAGLVDTRYTGTSLAERMSVGKDSPPFSNSQKVAWFGLITGFSNRQPNHQRTSGKVRLRRISPTADGCLFRWLDRILSMEVLRCVRFHWSQVLATALVLGYTQDQLGADVPAQPKTSPPSSQRQAAMPENVGNGSPQVRLQMLVVELFLTKLRASGNAFHTPVAKTASPSSPADRLFKNNVEPLGWTAVDENDPLLEKVEDCLARGQAKVVSQPTLRASTGQRSTLHMGGTIPYLTAVGDSGRGKVEWIRTGVCIDYVPAVVDNTVSLDLDVRLSELDEANAIMVEGQKLPALLVHAAVTASTKSKLGQVLVFFAATETRVVEPEPVAPVAEKKAKEPETAAEKIYEEVQTLILVRPQLAE